MSGTECDLVGVWEEVCEKVGGKWVVRCIHLMNSPGGAHWICEAQSVANVVRPPPIYMDRNYTTCAADTNVG